jgi:hypothetical protein
MTWQLPDTYHSAGTRRGTATLKFYEGRDILSLSARAVRSASLAAPLGVFPLPGSGERAARRHRGDRGRQDQDVDCYPEGTIIFSHLGVLANLQAALTPVGGAQDNDTA